MGTSFVSHLDLFRCDRHRERAILQANTTLFYRERRGVISSDEYSQENVALMEMLDRLTVDIPKERLAHLIDIFVACSRYEMMFWDMAWNMSG